MNSPKHYLILLLALTTAGGAALAWRQYQELTRLRASSLGTDERADWQKRLWAAEKRRHELEAALAASQATGAESRETDGPDGPLAAADGSSFARRRGGPGGNLAGNFMAMMDKPEVQRLMAIQQRGALDANFGALFKNLNLTPDQLEKFKSLLVERQTAIADVLAAARAQGIDPRSDPQEFRKLLADAQAEVDTSIKATLGDAAYAQYQQYQQTLPQRNVVNQLAQSLSYTNTPLTSDQSEQMVRILAANAPASASGTAAGNRAARDGGVFFGVGNVQVMGGGLNSSPITNDEVTQAQAVLSAPQVQALQQLQQTQQAQAELARTMRRQFGGRGNATPGATPSAPKGRPGG